MFIIDRNLMPTVVTPEAFSLESLIAWLETKDPGKSYDFCRSDHCLIGQWGKPDLYTSEIDRQTFPGALNIALDGEWTFGAALTRAREYARAKS